MDLGAYAKIDDLSQIMEDNGISVPRLRGLRLMSEEKPLTKEELEEQINDQWLWQCEKLCCSQFQLNAHWMDLNYKTSQIEQYYLIKKNGDTNGVRWNVLHGKKRKLFKFARKLVAKRVLKQYEIFNKYCGQEGILYIHARIGGDNWNYFGGPELAKQPWFIEKVDDAFDCTYCDIYARVTDESDR